MGPAVPHARTHSRSLETHPWCVCSLSMAKASDRCLPFVYFVEGALRCRGRVERVAGASRGGVPTKSLRASSIPSDLVPWMTIWTLGFSPLIGQLQLGVLILRASQEVAELKGEKRSLEEVTHREPLSLPSSSCIRAPVLSPFARLPLRLPALVGSRRPGQPLAVAPQLPAPRCLLVLCVRPGHAHRRRPAESPAACHVGCDKLARSLTGRADCTGSGSAPPPPAARKSACRQRPGKLRSAGCCQHRHCRAGRAAAGGPLRGALRVVPAGTGWQRGPCWAARRGTSPWGSLAPGRGWEGDGDLSGGGGRGRAPTECTSLRNAKTKFTGPKPLVALRDSAEWVRAALSDSFRSEY